MNAPFPASAATLATAAASLAELEAGDAFLGRHIAPDATERAAMLAELGYADLGALIDAVVPQSIRRAEPLPLPSPLPEHAALAELRKLAQRNQVLRSLIGQGYYGTLTPGVIQRNILENPAWYTAYTPYQPEISQGRLEAMINFQTMVSELSGMDIANASMLDEATAAAEAMTLILRSVESESKVFFVADDVLPQTLAVVRTRAAALELELLIGPAARTAELLAATPCFGALLQYPGADGELLELAQYRAVADAVHAQQGGLAVAADPLALTLLAPPGEWGADVAVGNTQRFGVPMGFGGPHAAYLATRDAFKRSMSGRLAGATLDANGKPAYRLALQTREQHIRREKATSNICTAQVLLAVIASMYAVYHGPEGLRRIGMRTHRLTVVLAEGLRRLGVKIANTRFFDTLTLDTGPATAAVHAAARADGYNLREIDAARLGVSLDEVSDRAEVLALWQVFAKALNPAEEQGISAWFTAINAAIEAGGAQTAGAGMPASLRRQSAYLTHPVFHRHHAEHEMLRYLRGLADKDLALDRSMIPLGSCTMKLNATSEMLPITWPEFNAIHPFAPAEQTVGYREMIGQLEAMLCAATGYAAVSLQPNAGSQGEYAGLLAISAWHASRGDARRKVCLIPTSAHGTNPASAQMAGMRVVAVACDAQGNVDLADLKAKAAQHAAELAAIMITYPSTHGVFEEGVREICDIVHGHGGQVYIDGANLNALVGTAAPGQFGGDVSHLNLHKTFCIPHGGGGPGVGPVAVAAHLAPFLPSTAQGNGKDGGQDEAKVGAVSAAPWGSASILPISWMYIAMMGGSGLQSATEHAILAANYVARKLAPYYPVLYTGAAGLVAHECILDLRPLKDSSGISNEDVAKRLMDYGFHAPTMSFPVPGTLMIEPTESESKAELDRFIEAMIAIRGEIAKVENGKFDREDNPLKHAPHTAEAVSADAWAHAYSRETAAYPVLGLRKRKYWPPVGRADNVYGDRNLFCSCLPVGE
ncbi:MAG: aminomethyl-transferring glycine dehydrogenase [Candidatus Protistobacter heckmanni]|nr:aminomethyl-transferring glycine dehydrogenase [Candidatus Protistobacter heckmanni]